MVGFVHLQDRDSFRKGSPQKGLPEESRKLPGPLEQCESTTISSFPEEVGTTEILERDVVEPLEVETSCVKPFGRVRPVSRETARRSGRVNTGPKS